MNDPTNSNRPELVIFDCDGVLVDSERLTINVEARLLTQLGWPITEAEVIERFMGGSDASMMAQIAERIGQDGADEFDRVSQEEIIAAFRDRLQPVEGVTELVDALAGAHVPTCIASSGSHRKMGLTLGLTGLTERFADRIFSATEVENGKPAPDLFLHAAASMGYPPSACVVIEDSATGVRGAVAAGMTCYGYAGGLTPRERLEDAGAIPFDTMTELQELLLT